jgi:lysine/ornithine N-monooxygenase
MDPGRVEVYSNMGVTYYNMGRYRESREEFERYLPYVKDPEEASRLREFIKEIKKLENGEKGDD